MSGRQIHFVTGKGGVGKSLVSVALARRFVDAGDKTLLCQVHARDSHSSLLGIAGPVPDDLQEVAPGLMAVNLNPAQATREYALMTLKVEAIYKAVFENRLTAIANNANAATVSMANCVRFMTSMATVF